MHSLLNRTTGYIYCPGKEAAMVIIISAAADHLYHIPLGSFYYVTGPCATTRLKLYMYKQLLNAAHLKLPPKARGR